MKKLLIPVLLIFIFMNTKFLYSAEKLCSEYNKITQNYKYKKCMAEIKKQGKVEGSDITKKNGNLLGKISEKYKDLREKAPKTGVETWKKYKSNKKN